MSDRVLVKCLNRKQWGTKVFGATGHVYYIHPEGGALHVMQGLVPDPTPGIPASLSVDRDEFEQFATFRVAGAKKATPPPPKRPPAGGAPGDADPEPPDPEGADDSAEAPPVPLVDQLPNPSDTKEAWLKWARSHGVALSPKQKASKKAEVIDTIAELAADKDAAAGL